MEQQTLAGFERYGKTRRRAQFFAQVDQMVPWPELATTRTLARPVARHLLERHKLGKKLLSTVNGYLARNGIKISGTIVDATVISAPSSTKNKDGKRDPEMHQAAKGH